MPINGTFVPMRFAFEHFSLSGCCLTSFGYEQKELMSNVNYKSKFLGGHRSA